MSRTLFGGAAMAWLALTAGAMAQVGDEPVVVADARVLPATHAAVAENLPPPSAEPAEPAAAPAIEPPEAIEQRHRAVLDACWARNAPGGAQAPVTVRLDVAGDGRVRTARIEGDAGRAVQRCLAREARRLTFPARPSGETSAPATVEYRFGPILAATGAAEQAPEVEAEPVVAARRRSRVRGSAELTSMQVRGGSVGPTVLESVVRRHVGALSACHAQVLVDDPGASGTATVRLEVSAEGRVTDASVRSSFRGDRVEQCIRDAVRNWSVPMPIGSAARVTMQVELVPRLRW